MRAIDADKLEDAPTEAGIPIIVKGKATSAWGVPIVDAEPVRYGHWVRVLDNRGLHFVCPYCGEWKYHQGQKYCGECGAKMTEVKDDGTD